MRTPQSSIGRPWQVFLTYTLWTIALSVLMVPLLAISFQSTRLEAAPLHLAPLILLAAEALASAWSLGVVSRRWARRPGSAERGPLDLPSVGTLALDARLLVAAGLCGALALATWATGTDPLVAQIGVVTLLASGLPRLPWGYSVAAAAVILAAGLLLGAPGPHLALLLAPMLAGVLVVRSSYWLAAMVRELDQAREAQSRLAVAEERLRFARDLHDVAGRDLSAIAVTAELVAQLAEREDPRAVARSREVAQIARSSLAEIRALVRGYREADLAAELRGTVSLLRSAQAEVTVTGSAEEVPAEHAERAAWVLREGGTNVLRHSTPGAVSLELHQHGVRIVNDGVPTDAGGTEGVGLQGMRERLGPGAQLCTALDGDTFTLDVRFPPTSGESA